MKYLKRVGQIYLFLIGILSLFGILVLPGWLGHNVNHYWYWGYAVLLPFLGAIPPFPSDPMAGMRKMMEEIAENEFKKEQAKAKEEANK